jgi:putative ABC transport system permease protein
MSLAAVLAHKLRSALTVLGIVIGITAVISLMSVGQGAQQQVTENIQSLGSNLLFVQAGAGRQQGGAVRSAVGSGSALTLDDAGAVVAAPGIVAVAPQVTTFQQVVAGSQNSAVQVLGTTLEYESVRNLTLAQGEFITESHERARSLVTVLGSNVAATLFPDTSPVGQTVRLGRRPFRVIGVLEPMGGGFGGFQDDVMIVPVTTAIYRLQAQRGLAGSPRIQTIYVQVADEVDQDLVKESVADILRQEHRIVGEDDFIITSQEDILETVSQVTGVFTIVLGAIAGISLLVGGIGVMNIMLVSVTERTREIGIRKAVGARRQDLILQFLMESMLLTLFGGALGVTAGWGLARLMSGVNIQGQSLVTVVSPDIVLLALAVSVGVGLFFGVYPATRAARLHPVEALRHE